jgi:integrase
MTTPKRLPEGVRKLDSGHYQARYSAHGKQVSAGVFPTAAKARDARATALAELRAGTWVDPSGPRMTFEAWAAEYAELVGTDKRMQSFLRVHILPRWGLTRLGDIEVADVQRWVNALYTTDLSPSTAAAVYAAFKRMMARAVDYDRLVKTPCRLIRIPKAQRSEQDVLLPADIALIEAEMHDRYRAMVHLAAWTGLRWQECAALRWEDVDLEAGVLNVCRAVKADGKVGPPKNGKTREVVMPPSVVAALRKQRRDYGATGPVFPTERGKKVLNYSFFRRSIWEPAVKRAGITPAPSFHKLRHAYVGIMRMQNVSPDVVSEQVGHHSAAFTMERYGWRRPDYRERIVEAVERAQEVS